MKGFTDELAATGKPVGEDELISFILAGLDMDYTPLVSALDAQTTHVSLDALYG